MTHMYSVICVCVLQVQKEKLHAELKQVLSKKRSQFRESTCQLATPEMDTEPTEEQKVSSNLKKKILEPLSCGNVYFVYQSEVINIRLNYIDRNVICQLTC